MAQFMNKIKKLKRNQHNLKKYLLQQFKQRLDVIKIDAKQFQFHLVNPPAENATL